MTEEEKVINDVLCWRNTPDGDWHSYTAVELTLRLTTLEFSYNELLEDFDDCIDREEYATLSEEK